MAHNRKRERHKKGTLGKKKNKPKSEKTSDKKKEKLSYTELGASCL